MLPFSFSLHQQLLLQSFPCITRFDHSNHPFIQSTTITFLIIIKMQSIIALAGVVGLAAASYAPSYDDDVRATTQAAAVPTAYDAPTNFRTVDAQLPSYGADNDRTVDAQLPSYGADNDRATLQPYESEAPRLTWSTTKYIRTSAYTTYCPEATTLSFNTKTYTVTAATTLTVTDCYNGCEVVKPLPTTTTEQTTSIVQATQFETYCPEPTTLTFSAKTWTVTQATTLTIPQNITTTSVFKTVIPVQPTYAPVNSTVRVSTTYQSPVAPVPTVEPYVPEKTVSPVVEPYVPGTTESPSFVAPAPTYEAPVATTATYDAVVPPYPIAPSKTAVYYQPTGTGTGRVYPTAPLYTGAAVANRVGAGAFMAVAGFAALL